MTERHFLWIFAMVVEGRTEGRIGVRVRSEEVLTAVGNVHKGVSCAMLRRV